MSLDKRMSVYTLHVNGTTSVREVQVTYH